MSEKDTLEKATEAAEAEAAAKTAEADADEAQSEAVTATAAAAQGAVAAAEAGAALAQANAAEANLTAAEKIEESEEKWAHLGSQMEILHQRTQSLETGLQTMGQSLSEMMGKLENNLKTLLTPPPPPEAEPGTSNPSEGAEGRQKTPPEQPSPNEKSQKPSRQIRRL